jgi:hypothetical protein
MKKHELIESLKDIPDDIEVIASSESHNDIYEILSVKNMNDGVVYLEIGESWEKEKREMTPEKYKKFKEWLQDRQLLYRRGANTDGENVDDRFRNAIQSALCTDILVVLNTLENEK